MPPDPLTPVASPYARLLGLLQHDDLRLVMPYAEGLMGRPGFLHGGAISGLLENAAWVAVRAATEPGATLKPIGFTVEFLRGGQLVDTHARGTVERLGRRLANLSVSAWQDDEARPIAIASMRVMIG